MKSLIAIIAILWCSLAVWSQTAETNSGRCGAGSEPAPHLQLDSAYIDLGKIGSDSIVETTMRFCNTGDAPLQIIRIFSDCGCTSPEYSDEEVQPGECGEIKVRFNGKNRTAGAFRKTLRILSNADNPRQSLAIKGIIK